MCVSARGYSKDSREGKGAGGGSSDWLPLGYASLMLMLMVVAVVA